jgi:hypothetical protein
LCSHIAENKGEDIADLTALHKLFPPLNRTAKNEEPLRLAVNTAKRKGEIFLTQKNDYCKKATSLRVGR